MTITCWCGNTELKNFSNDYMKCARCNTLVSVKKNANSITRVSDDNLDFYGKDYWFSHQEKDLALPDILSRARTDLPERCIHWLKSLLKYKLPPAKVIELGSSHGGFVAMMRWAGFDAAGLELSPWIVDFSGKTFSIPVHLGPVEDQHLETSSFDAIVLMDVLEHLPDPVATMRHCFRILKPDGILLVQTPYIPENMSYEQMLDEKSSFLSLLIKDEHFYLFNKRCIKEFFNNLGAGHIEFEPAIFSHYDMFLVASRNPLATNSPDEIDEALASTHKGRMTRAMLDIKEVYDSLQKKYNNCEDDRAARLEVIHAQGEEIQKRDTEIQKSDAEIQKRDAEIQKRDAEIQKRDTEIQKRDTKIAEFESNLNLIQSSLSWKITMPLRRLRKIMFQILKKI